MISAWPRTRASRSSTATSSRCAGRPLAVAEIAAQLGLHIGVARVLVADLAASGYVIVRRPGTTLANDLDTIERVIRGLEAIR